MLSEIFGETKINSSISCDEVIAMGACLKTRELLFNEGQLTLPNEVNVHSISISIVDHNGKSFDVVVVEPNTRIPFSNEGNPIYAVKDNSYQTDIEILLKENSNQLGKLHLTHLFSKDNLISIFLKIESGGTFTFFGECGNSKEQTIVKISLKQETEEDDLTDLKRRIENFFN
ncbi:hypothetical protein QTN25_005882 [Entamoeba marina]